MPHDFSFKTIGIHGALWTLIHRAFHLTSVRNYAQGYNNINFVVLFERFESFSFKEGFRKVDYDYTVGVAKLAKKNGCKEFHLVSSAGANKDSSLLYTKTKGEAEVAIGELGFEKYSIYRPK